MLRTDSRIKKGQVALEFLVLVGISFFVFLSLMTIMFYHTQKLRDTKENQMVMDVADTIQNEINSASNVKDGYIRQFALPMNLQGKEYTITKYANRVHVSTARYQADAIVPDYIGDIHVGINTINKTGGIVYITT
jgi:uncharacterized protein (UPF0333 family)